MKEVNVVLKKFSDKNGEGGVYLKGDLYPKSSVSVKEERLKVLFGDNKYDIQFIEKKAVKELTVTQLKQLLERDQIQYDHQAKKAELLALVK